MCNFFYNLLKHIVEFFIGQFVIIIFLLGKNRVYRVTVSESPEISLEPIESRRVSEHFIFHRVSEPIEMTKQLVLSLKRDN